MQRFFTLLFVFGLTAGLSAQTTPQTWPHQLTQEEVEAAVKAGYTRPAARGIETPPDFESLRTMAEWEEVQALMIGWQAFPSILKAITAAAKLECEVIILSEDPDATESYLLANNAGGSPLPNLDNVTIIEAPLNTIWARDYAATTVYANEVEDVLLIDWIYNRPRPDDDVSPEIVANHLGIDLYSTTAPPYELMGTGGNFMSDGFGTGFSSELIVDENSGGESWWGPYPEQFEAGVMSVMNAFMGIEEYVLMPTLPYDGIHHIDMHMKLLDEETLLMAEYPQGVADGPQINANLEYVLSNYTTRWGTPFKVIRIPSPPQQSNGNFPDDDGWYLTYTNSLFINKTVLVPTYYTQYDTTALRIYEEALPGYNIIGIDCDSQPNNIIQQSGALHCITHEVGANNPLLISHLPLNDTEDDLNDYEVVAYMNHRLGVVEGTLYYKTSISGDYTEVAMTSVGGNEWQAFIPAQAVGSTIYYYVKGEAADGKVQVRPMPAPEGYWSFRVLGEIVHIADAELGDLQAVFPNPAGAITCVPVVVNGATPARIYLADVTGRVVHTLFEGTLAAGERKFFFDAQNFAPGAYLVVFEGGTARSTQRVLIK
jgi:agmatine/peptidylarginine deiminase